MHARTLIGLGFEECPGSEKISLSAATPVFRRGDSQKWVHLLESGIGTISLPGSGGQTIITLIRQGDIFGDEAVLEKSRHSFDADVLCESKTLRIPAGEFLNCLEKRPETARAVLRHAAERQLAMAHWIESLRHETVGPRVLHVLVALAEAMPPVGSAGWTLPLTQSQLAPLVGATRETTSHRLNDLARAGLIHLRRRLISIPNLEALRRYERPNRVRVAHRDPEAHASSA